MDGRQALEALQHELEDRNFPETGTRSWLMDSLRAALRSPEPVAGEPYTDKDGAHGFTKSYPPKEAPVGQTGTDTVTTYFGKDSPEGAL